MSRGICGREVGDHERISSEGGNQGRYTSREVGIRYLHEDYVSDEEEGPPEKKTTRAELLLRSLPQGNFGALRTTHHHIVLGGERILDVGMNVEKGSPYEVIIFSEEFVEGMHGDRPFSISPGNVILLVRGSYKVRPSVGSSATLHLYESVTLREIINKGGVSSGKPYPYDILRDTKGFSFKKSPTRMRSSKKFETKHFVAFRGITLESGKRIDLSGIPDLEGHSVYISSSAKKGSNKISVNVNGKKGHSDVEPWMISTENGFTKFTILNKSSKTKIVSVVLD